MENLEQWGLLRKTSKSLWLTSNRAPSVNACVVAGAEHAVSLDINVLLEGAPPQDHPAGVRGKKEQGATVSSMSDNQHTALFWSSY